MTGYYLMWRGWLENDQLKETKYCKPMAWCWLIEHAAWKDHYVVYKGKKVNIKRGQIPTSLRSLVKEWKWSQNRILRFINGLKTAAMIDVKTEAGFYVITLCNYEEYQISEKQTEALTEAQTEAPAEALTEANRIQGNKTKKEYKKKETVTALKNDANQKPLFEDLPEMQPEEALDQFPEFWKTCLKKADKPAARKAWDRAITRAEPDIIIAGAKRYAEERADEIQLNPDSSRYTKNPATWLNNDSWENYEETFDEEPEENISESEKVRRTLLSVGLQ